MRPQAARLPALLVATVLAALFVAGRDAAPAVASPPVFDPGGIVCFETLETEAECDGDSSPGAASDLRMKFCTGWGDDCAQSPLQDVGAVKDSLQTVFVFFAPPEWSVPEPGEVPIGALAGRVSSVFTWGFLNNPCRAIFQSAYNLINGSLDPQDTISMLPNGNRQPLALDLSPQNGIPDGADRFPTYVSEVAESAELRARLMAITRFGHFGVYHMLILEPGSHLTFGATDIKLDPGLGYPIVTIVENPLPSTQPDPMSDMCAPDLQNIVLFGKTIDNPCTPTPTASAHCPGFGQMFLFQGYPFLPCEGINSFDDDGDGAVNDGCPQYLAEAETGKECANDISDELEDALVNDGCPQVGDVGEGARIPGTCDGADEGGCTFLANAASGGAHAFTSWAETARDTDSDGIDNALDVCALAPNGAWNSRIIDLVNDPDRDGLPNECDPFPNQVGALSPTTICPLGIIGYDEDKDCYANRDDNCPNVNQLTSTDPGLATPDNTDTDEDEIGDACDPEPLLPNGEKASLCLRFGLIVGAPAMPVIGVPDPNPGPGCADPKWGDVDCGGVIDSVDALRVQRDAAGLPNQLPKDCVFDGDVDCSGKTDSADALRLLRHRARLSNPTEGGCPAIGS